MFRVLEVIKEAFRRTFPNSRPSTPDSCERRDLSLVRRPPLSMIDRQEGPLLTEPLEGEAKSHRLTDETLELIRHNITAVKEQILPATEAFIPKKLLDFTTYELLRIALSDWTANGNRYGLNSQDAQDFQSFVWLANHLSEKDETRSDNTKQLIYRVTLKALLQDWLLNWNAEGTKGAPQRSPGESKFLKPC